MREAAEVREWLKKAEDDFAGALHLSRRRKKPLPDLVCFHYSVRFRYPGEEATAEEARLAIKAIKKIAVFIRDLFPRELLPSTET
ncbi:hypothetical protein EDS67_07285 [candidate division KSB1 bacterium]|nr:MAG: hypothetical protein EDS67_07285 [candidate division KSB1 bacterium]MBC6950554.1 hypothetical protein [candidate division KSB1 bacterium]MCE7941392.1 hypothetical protein [Chlorobi bacterium CHB1]MDL1877510.1 hypothetical protein [Cytophagia bacterium CHB2]